MMVNFDSVLKPDLCVRNVDLLELRLTLEHLYDGYLFFDLTLFQLCRHIVIYISYIRLSIWFSYSCSSRYDKLYRSFCCGYLET